MLIEFLCLCFIVFLAWIFFGDIYALITFRGNWTVPAKQELLGLLAIGLITSIGMTTMLMNVMCFLNLRRVWWWYLPYVVYTWFDRSHSSGSKRKAFLRQLGIFYIAFSYFPATIKKDNPTEEIYMDKPYIFGLHPHGVFSYLWYGTFLTNALGFKNAYPGLTIYPATLNVNFGPFSREIIGGLGAVSCEKSTLHQCMAKGGGNGICLALGGAAEALLSKPGSNKVIITRRQGMFELALKYGAYLVPVYGFGETELFEPVYTKSGPVVFVSNMVKRLFGFTMPFSNGRGLFQKDFGLLPKQTPLTAVFGEPIKCTKIEQPTNEDINQLRTNYIKKLEILYKKHAPNCSEENTPRELEVL